MGQGVWGGGWGFHDLSGVPLSPHLHLFSNLDAFRTPYDWNFMEDSSHTCDQSLTPFSALLLYQESGRCGWKFQAPNNGLLWLVTSPHPGVDPIVTSFEQKMPLPPSRLQGFQERCFRNCGQRQTLEQRMLLMLLSLRKSHEFQELCASSQGQRPTHTFYSLTLNCTVLPSTCRSD